MSALNGEYDYEPEVLEWLEKRAEDYSVLELYMQVEEKAGRLYEDTIELLSLKCKYTYQQSKRRLAAWHSWRRYTWEITCENCGCRIMFGRDISNFGCACGAIYIQDSWNVCHRDDTMGGKCTTKVGVNGTVIKTIELS